MENRGYNWSSQNNSFSELRKHNRLGHDDIFNLNDLYKYFSMLHDIQKNISWKINKSYSIKAILEYPIKFPFDEYLNDKVCWFVTSIFQSYSKPFPIYVIQDEEYMSNKDRNIVLVWFKHVNIYVINKKIYYRNVTKCTR